MMIQQYSSSPEDQNLLDDLLADNFNAITEKVDRSLLEELQEKAVDSDDQDDDEYDDLQQHLIDNQIFMQQQQQQNLISQNQADPNKIDIFDEGTVENPENDDQIIIEKQRNKKYHDQIAIQILQNIANELKITKTEGINNKQDTSLKSMRHILSQNQNFYQKYVLQKQIQQGTELQFYYSNNLIKLLFKSVFDTIMAQKSLTIQFTLSVRKLLKLHNLYENLKETTVNRKREGIFKHKHAIAKQIIIEIFSYLSPFQTFKTLNQDPSDLIDFLEKLLDLDDDSQQALMPQYDSISQEFIIASFQEVLNNSKKQKSKKQASNSHQNDNEFQSAQDPYQFMYQMYGYQNQALEIPEDTEYLDETEDKNLEDAEKDDQSDETQNENQIENIDQIEINLPQKEQGEVDEKIKAIEQDKFDLNYIDEYVNSKGFLYLLSNYLRVSLTITQQLVAHLGSNLKNACFIVSSQLMGSNLEMLRTQAGKIYINQDLILKLTKTYLNSDDKLKQREGLLLKLRLLIIILSQTI
ncbi:UNKNOWN [Stylonychia lemnae]|uniref:Uncharacterized protein n=1 Tax=Stylonychia lemnae TaxID=5949 RepID=A0A078ADE0_STYLE|nr:UNKNOWN [Stylonychia lemnae]|eukprot:CDW79861.1 UNKNOWN [Stylonychia lemnae]